MSTETLWRMEIHVKHKQIECFSIRYIKWFKKVQKILIIGKKYIFFPILVKGKPLKKSRVLPLQIKFQSNFWSHIFVSYSHFWIRHNEELMVDYCLDSSISVPKQAALTAHYETWICFA